MTTRRAVLAGGLAFGIASGARGQGSAARATCPAGTFLGIREGGVARSMAPVAGARVTF